MNILNESEIFNAYDYMDTIKIQIPSISENIRIIESFIDNAKEKFRLDDDIYGNIMIAVTESVNNAIIHGNKNDRNKNVSISLTLNENILKFLVKDEGDGFDFQNLPDPTAPENIDKPSGRGIFLMKHLSDEVCFKENGKLVELSFYMF
jgi:serine/threonine-protein kinase RsbW